MARNDIQIYIQKAPTEYGLLTASANFDEGDAVVVIGAGTLSEVSDPEPTFITGIAAQRSTDFNGDVNAGGTPITFYPARPDNTFSTVNFSTAGAGTAATPTAAHVGDTAGIVPSGGVWWLDTSADNHLATVTGVLNAKGESIQDPHTVDTTGVTVLFRFN